MDYRSEWTAGALSKLRSIIVRVARNDPAAAMRLQSAIQQKIALLRSFPMLAEIYARTPAGEIREAQVGNYRIFYLLGPGAELIKVIRIQHVKMKDPDFGD